MTNSAHNLQNWSPIISPATVECQTEKTASHADRQITANPGRCESDIWVCHSIMKGAPGWILHAFEGKVLTWPSSQLCMFVCLLFLYVTWTYSLTARACPDPVSQSFDNAYTHLGAAVSNHHLLLLAQSSCTGAWLASVPQLLFTVGLGSKKAIWPLTAQYSSLCPGSFIAHEIFIQNKV